MMNYAAAFGALDGLITWIAIECKHATKPLDGKELAAKLTDAVKKATERGWTYDNDHVNPDRARE